MSPGTTTIKFKHSLPDAGDFINYNYVNKTVSLQQRNLSRKVKQCAKHAMRQQAAICFRCCSFSVLNDVITLYNLSLHNR